MLVQVVEAAATLAGAAPRHVKAVRLMERSCPACQGHGFSFCTRRAKGKAEQLVEDVCRLCHGRGVVVDRVCAGCGRPAPWNRCGVWYCGGKRCRKLLLVKAKRLEKKPCDHVARRWSQERRGWECIRCHQMEERSSEELAQQSPSYGDDGWGMFEGMGEA